MVRHYTDHHTGNDDNNDNYSDHRAYDNHYNTDQDDSNSNEGSDNDEYYYDLYDLVTIIIQCQLDNTIDNFIMLAIDTPPYPTENHMLNYIDSPQFQTMFRIQDSRIINNDTQRN